MTTSQLLNLAAVLTATVACSGAPDSTPTSIAPDDAAIDTSADDETTGLDTGAPGWQPSHDTGAPDTTPPAPIDTGTVMIDTGVADTGPADTFTGTVVTFPAPGDSIVEGPTIVTWTTEGGLRFTPTTKTRGAAVVAKRALTGSYSKCTFRVAADTTDVPMVYFEFPFLSVAIDTVGGGRFIVSRYVRPTDPKVLTGDCSIPIPGMTISGEVTITIRVSCNSDSSSCLPLDFRPTATLTLEP